MSTVTVVKGAQLVWALSKGQRIMIGVRAGFDLSSAHGVTAIAGYIANFDAWKAIEPRWLSLRGSDRFRLFDWKKRFNDGWIDAVMPLADLIREADLCCVSALLKHSDWKLLPHDDDYLRICPTQRHACLDMLFPVVADEMRFRFNNEPLTIVFDRDYGLDETAHAVHNAWAERAGHAGFGLYFKEQVDWGVVPLECADLVAGVLRIDPMGLAMLQNDFTKIDDNNPLSSLSSKLLSGRGCVWSQKVAERVKEMEKKRPNLAS